MSKYITKIFYSQCEQTVNENVEKCVNQVYDFAKMKLGGESSA